MLFSCILGSPRVQRLSSRAIVEAYALRPTAPTWGGKACYLKELNMIKPYSPKSVKHFFYIIFSPPIPL